MVNTLKPGFFQKNIQEAYKKRKVNSDWAKSNEIEIDANLWASLQQMDYIKPGINCFANHII